MVSGEKDFLNHITDSELARILLETSQFIPNCESFEDAARYIFDKCKQLTGARSGYVALLDEKGDENKVLFLDAGGMPCTVDPSLPMPIRGLRGEAYEKGEAVYDNDFFNSKWMDFMPEGHVKLDNVMFAPLMVKEKAVGLIGLANKFGDFNQDDAKITTALSYLGAIALAHARDREEIAEKESGFRQITDLMDETLSVLDLEGTFLFANKNTTLNMRNGVYKSILGKNLADFISPEQAEQNIALYKDVYASGEQLRREVAVNLPRGTAWFINTLQPMEFGSEKIPAILSVGLDITQQKKIENDLLESEEKYRSMMASMDEAAYICSSDFHIEYMNPAMIKDVGRDATGELCFKAIHGLDDNCPWCRHAEVMRGEKKQSELIKPDQDEVYFVSEVPIFHTDGRVSKLTIYRDVTEQKKIEARIQQAQKLEAVGTLAGGIAHDFNNILTPILGLSEMLIDDLQPGTFEYENAEQIFQAGERASALVKQILAFSRKSDETIIPVGFQTVIKEVVKLCRSTMPKNIRFVENIDNSCGLVRANPTHLHQIAMNVITNAYHALEEKGGQITLDLYETYVEESSISIETMLEPGSYAVFVCTDTGHGIDPEVKDKVLEPYFTTKPKDKGTGLGLSVVYGIVKEYDGDLAIESEVNRGTSIRIMIPTVDDLTSEKLIRRNVNLPGGSESILLIDDEKSLLRMMQKSLERLGYKVTSTLRGQDGVDMFSDNPLGFDLVLTDMMMPEITGEDVVREVRKVNPDIPVIIYTGFSDRIDEDNFVSLGVNGLLKKPVLRADLAFMVRKVLDK